VEIRGRKKIDEEIALFMTLSHSITCHNKGEED
jgi:hypothetical protein